MLSHMIIQIAFCPGSIITCCTFEWFLPGMNAHMNLYALFLSEAFPAYLTVIGPFTRVRPVLRTKLGQIKTNLKSYLMCNFSVGFLAKFLSQTSHLYLLVRLSFSYMTISEQDILFKLFGSCFIVGACCSWTIVI